MRRRRFLWMVFCCALGLIPAGELRAEARHLPEPPKVASASTQQPEAPAHESATCAVPARRAWTKTDLTVQPGTPIHLEADGKAQMVGWRVWDWLSGSEVDRWVGPQGTYRWPRHYRMRDPNATFPLPAMADGPFPAFCLIGKIGETGQPFYVGSRYDGTASTAGRLWLGINDDTFQDNAGAFQASIQLVAHPASIPQEPPVIQPGSYAGTPVPHARVLLIYVDGLRPDVVQELAEAGFLPNFKRTFLDRGLVAPYAFTVFPSNTLIANGSLFTGRFSDRTGIKSQNQFERSTLKLTGQLSAWLPDGFMPKPTTRVLNLLDKYAPENTHAFLVKRGIPTLATYLSKAYAFTTLPIAPLNPPPQWFHRALNTLGPFGISSRLPWGLDAVNGEYAVEDLIGNPDARVVAIWFPMVDKTSHHSGHGQFGAARRDLVLVDDWLGRILRRMREVGWESSTYLIVVSDHGHVGGTRDINRPCHLPRDWAHRALGWSAKVVGQEWIHPGIRASQFVFFDN
ncbi:MAG: alkaline phosphatase family protein, partial [Candidatus Omnitrophica bacterium]|nr:alkaline phosphatase family protein [Candidatus Omnitrophota bacterium]